MNTGGDRGSTVVTVPQIGRSLVRSQLVSLEFFIDIKSFRSHYGTGVDSASNRNQYQEHFLGGKGGRCGRLTTLQPSCAVVMKSGNLNFLEPSGTLQPCNGTALPLWILTLCQYGHSAITDTLPIRTLCHYWHSAITDTLPIFPVNTYSELSLQVTSKCSWFSFGNFLYCRWKKISENRKFIVERHDIGSHSVKQLRAIRAYREEERPTVYTDKTYLHRRLLCIVVSFLVCIVVSCLVCIVVVVLCVLLSSFVYLLYYVCIAVFTLDAGLPVRSQYSEGPATGHLDTGFSRFPCVYKQMLRWFPRFQVATTCFSYIPPDLNVLVTNFIFCMHVK